MFFEGWVSGNSYKKGGVIIYQGAWPVCYNVVVEMIISNNPLLQIELFWGQGGVPVIVLRIFTPTHGEGDPNLMSICFKWVGSNTKWFNHQLVTSTLLYVAIRFWCPLVCINVSCQKQRLQDLEDISRLMAWCGWWIGCFLFGCLFLVLFGYQNNEWKAPSRASAVSNDAWYRENILWRSTYLRLFQHTFGTHQTFTNRL